MTEIEWPENPKEGEFFSYIDPIGGADWINYRFENGHWKHIKQDYSMSYENYEYTSPAVRDVVSERARQITKEGWSLAHDDIHTDGSLAAVAACYAFFASLKNYDREDFKKLFIKERALPVSVYDMWPSSWTKNWWKPKSRREDLVRAGALIIAEIERLDRDAFNKRRENYTGPGAFG